MKNHGAIKFDVEQKFRQFGMNMKNKLDIIKSSNFRFIHFKNFFQELKKKVWIEIETKTTNCRCAHLMCILVNPTKFAWENEKKK